MLVLTRKLNQQIQLGDNIKITVLRVKGNTIRLGIDAPRDVRVVRGELEPLPNESGASHTVYAAVTDQCGDASGQEKASTEDARPGQVARTSPVGRSDGVRSGAPLGAFLPAALCPSTAGLSA